MRSRAQLRAIFRALRDAGIVAGSGAGVYYGGRKLRQYLKKRKQGKELQRIQEFENLVTARKPSKNVVEIVRKEYGDILEGASPEERAELIRLGKFSKRESREVKKLKLPELIRRVRRDSLRHALYEAGAKAGREEAEDIYLTKIRVLEQMSRAHQEAAKSMQARGTAVPGLTEEGKPYLEKAGAIIAGQDPESLIEKKRAWLNQRRKLADEGLISEKKYMKSVISFNKYKRTVLGKARREAKYKEKSSPLAYIRRDIASTLLPSERRELRQERRKMRALGRR
jgi:hypothetical protein